MSPFRVIGVLIVFATLMAGRGLWSTVVIRAAEPHFPGAISHTTTVPDTLVDDAQRNQDIEQPEIDLFGNEVDEAVGDYRVDIRGDIYERHSPDTEVSRLSPPVG
jgi:hypothetical protein